MREDSDNGKQKLKRKEKWNHGWQEPFLDEVRRRKELDKKSMFTKR
jgi:hypothetical protein